MAANIGKVGSVGGVGKMPGIGNLFGNLGRLATNAVGGAARAVGMTREEQMQKLKEASMSLESKMKKCPKNEGVCNKQKFSDLIRDRSGFVSFYRLKSFICLRLGAFL